MVGRNVAAHLHDYSETLPEGPEKELARELVDNFHARTFFDESQMLQRAGQHDLGGERYNGQPTARNTIKALETLRRFGIITERHFEQEKFEALASVEARLKETLN